MSKIVNIVETMPINKIKYCLVSSPDVGLVGAIASGYILHEQQMTEIGYLDSEDFPPVMVVHQGEPKLPLRIFAKGETIAVASEIPIDPHLIPHVALSIIDWVKLKGCELIISLSGIAIQNRLDIDIPEVYGVASSSSVKELMRNMSIKSFEEGFVAGLHATVMKECLKKNIPNLLLLAQSHLQYPDPGAAASIISTLNKLIGLKVDTKKLLEQEDEIRLKMRELMQRTQQQMRETQKGREQEIPPMYV
ncbi:MAG: proteasome assembly chaperone family protein [Candidatus Bathyarchaeota archaeon]